ncbi:Protein dedA [Nostocoides japonicum T1-X7]|uniref:Protein dedA n=1 Tax=Nostocoides japonicum T1-X7 TaxID=1194083 RepID=A0A077M5I2_9MICO|nr:Protein dedA [Tetrasphaera japonica T1-X7]
MIHTLGPDWLHPATLLNDYGMWVAVVVVFIECGLLFPILPGDSLLFTIGVFIANGTLHLNLFLACLILTVAAFAGNVVGYEIGRAIGPPIYRRNGRFLRQEYFDKTHDFFDKYGNKALVLGRFVPIVRTFITLVAGVGRMDRTRFLTWSALGALLWASGVTILGYFLGNIAIIRDNIEAALVLIVLVSVLPMAVEYLRHRRRAIAATAALDEASDERDPRP